MSTDHGPLSMEAIDAVVFDLDGVLIDSERIYLQAWLKVAEEIACPELGPAYTQVVGLPYDEIEPIVEKILNDKVSMTDFRAAMMGAVGKQLTNGYPLKTGAMEILQFLQSQGVPCAVATSSTTSVPVKLQDTGIGHFFCHVVTRDEVARGKPHPDVYLKAAEQLGLAPSRCLAVEDSEPGLQAALASGMQVVHVPDIIIVSSDLTAACRAICSDLLALRDWLTA